jgi:drug/metabolite transporter (DMT)-like permease
MIWFFIALLGYLLLAVVFVLDKFILTKSIGNPAVYTFYSTIFMLAALVAYPFGVELLQGVDWLWAIVSGVTFGFALWSMFIAVKKGEASHINPFIGGFITIFTFGFAAIFLSETLSQFQLAGMIILVFASLLLSFEKRRGSSGIHIGYAWAILAGLLFAISHTTAKYIYDLYPFITGFVWTRATTGLVGLLLLWHPSVRSTFKKKNTKKTNSKKHVFTIVFSNKALSVVAIILIQYAIAIGSVTLVNAMVGIQYVIMFLFILFMTKFFPKVFKEYVTKKELAVEWIALLFVVIGSAMFVL